MIGRSHLGLATAWAFAASNGEDHTVTDATGMSLFDSGPRGATRSFTYSYFAAGSYGVIDRATSIWSTIQVRPLARPSAGTESTAFKVIWASPPSRPGFVYDVQILRPLSTRYVPWQSATTPRSGEFVPDAGVGSYSFRARLRQIDSAQHSGWSPAVTIAVS
jgi:hypothetical protein